MTEPTDTWTELRRLADELELKIHLAGMEARDRWRVIQPKLAEVEQAIERAGQRADEVVAQKLSKLGLALRKLADDLATTGKQ
jgi:hypothetical protein